MTAGVSSPTAMHRLDAERVYRRCDPSTLGFATTAELPDAPLVFGQDRVVDAIAFGIGMRRDGYNMFALGPTGAGKHAIVRRFLEDHAASEPPARDWCYVNNFAQPHRPRAVSLPKGRAAAFRDDVAQLVEELRTAITSALETEEYRQHHQQIHDEFARQRDQALDDLRTRAAAADVGLVQTPLGMGLVPIRDGQPLDDEALQRLTESERQRLSERVHAFEADLERLVRDIPKWHRETHDKLRALKQAATKSAVDALIAELEREYADEGAVLTYLAALRADVVENADDFRQAQDDNEAVTLSTIVTRAAAGSPLARYHVNVLDDHGTARGAPVVYEDKPTFQNLIGRIEYVSHMGTLVTDFAHIKAGALHKANGGYLILDARRVLTEPFAWDALKRALRARSIRIESLGDALSLVSTVSLEAEPIPLDVKVVLIGERFVYYLLHELDPDFRELFKTAIDFESDADRTAGAEREFAGVVATLARQASLRPLAAGGVARIVEEASRAASDASKLSIALDRLTDLLREADYWAGVAQHASVEAADVQRAIDARVHRAEGPRQRLQEAIARGTILVATSGAVVGQVNGLSVVELGGFAFAVPSRITARVRLGNGSVVDIEREVELGGPVHSKGVLILSGFLGGRYLSDQPLSVTASLVFEQSYGAVEGDSASCAELYALLSALADVPLRQSIAVTGSLSQHGAVQPVGGINEKIEGFFDVCAARRLTGDQGVLIPSANMRHLMLRDDVVRAIDDGKFHVYAVETIDEGLEVLTGMQAGARAGRGRFSPGTVNGRVEERLAAFASQARAFRTSAEESRVRTP